MTAKSVYFHNLINILSISFKVYHNVTMRICKWHTTTSHLLFLTTHMAVYSCICSWLYFGDLSRSSCHLVPSSPAAEASVANDTSSHRYRSLCMAVIIVMGTTIVTNIFLLVFKIVNFIRYCQEKILSE